LNEARYQLVDGKQGTLPYHSWMVIKGDEDWPPVDSEAATQTLLEPYLQGFAYSETKLRLTRPLASKERVFALGERTGPMNKHGQAFPIWNADPPIHHIASLLTMHASIPFYIGLQQDRAYGILIDHTGHTEMDMGKSNEAEASMTVDGDSLIVYFFAGPTPADILRQYTDLTGHMPLPARWTIGYHQCRWGYKTEQQVLAVARRLRERHHPCDAIWLDIDYMQGYRNFTWNPETFPHPTQMMQHLHEQGMHVVTIVDPGTKIDDEYAVYRQGMQQDYFCSYENGEYFKGTTWPGACVFPDFSRSEVRAWWVSLYQGLLDQGVDGIWNDMNEPATTSLLPSAHNEVYGSTMDSQAVHRAGKDQPTEPDGPPVLHKFFHNAYGLEMARSSYEGLSRLRPSSRPFVLSRSGTTGIQRYAALWTGDNSSEWETIPLSLRMCLNIGMSGIPFIGPDIGGFWYASDGELLVRFVQMVALMPFCRNHNHKDSPDQEPWAFGEPYESAFRKAIETRYQLIPYLYTLFQEASATGAPVMRPFYYHYPQDEQACDVETAFLVGDTLLSAPISEPGVTSRRVYLPEGSWFDYWDGTEYLGKTSYDIVAPLDRWPLLVRGNSILPTGPVMQYTDQYPTDPLTFTCYMTSNGIAKYTHYEDDGSTQEYHKGVFAKACVNCRVENDVVTVEIEEQHNNYKPTRQEYEIIVQIGGRVLQQRVKAGQGRVKVQWSIS
jgi:alpha-glucosidase